MKNRKKDMPTLIVKNLATYFPNFYLLLYTPFIITKEGCFYEYDGERIAAETFENMYPIELERRNGTQLDGRTNFY